MDSLSCNCTLCTKHMTEIWLVQFLLPRFQANYTTFTKCPKNYDYSVDLKMSLPNTWRKLVGVLLCKPEHIHASASVGIASKINDKCWSLNTGLRLQLHAVRNHPCLPVYELRQARLGCVALAVSFSGFHSVCFLICCTDQTVILNSSLLWVAWSSLNSVLLATVA